MKKPGIISKSILIDASIGICFGFFILHPLSMIIQNQKEIFDVTRNLFFIARNAELCWLRRPRLHKAIAVTIVLLFE